MNCFGLAGGEFCELQTLNASCRQGDEVVVMETARYGRMRLGTCVVADLGFVGCSRDVLPVLDSRCSGRRRCVVRVPDPQLAALRPQPCLTELKSYLETGYRCQKGQFFSVPRCSRQYRQLIITHTLTVTLT